MQQVEINRITVNEIVQQRVQLDETVIFEYTELIEDGGQFPPLKVFDDGQNLILADGRHRYEAYQLVEIDMVPVEIIKGTERDAILYAVGANADHGLRRTNDDKRYAVKTMLDRQRVGRVVGWRNRPKGARQSGICQQDQKGADSKRI